MKLGGDFLERLTGEASERRLPHHGAIEVFSRIHQRQQSA